MATFEIGATDFLLDRRPMQILSGALHYFRIHPDLWADRIAKARQLGLNTIETYVAWNFHEPVRGTFDTSGPRDLGRFLDTVAAAGLHAIVRPGPYICAEWDNGGLPTWLTSRKEIGIRRNDPAFLDAVGEYLENVADVIAPRQVTAGGPVLMVQVENEYGAYGNDPDYLRALRDLTRKAGIDVPLCTCDQADDSMLTAGGLPELLRTVTFGSRSRERLALLRRHQPTGPLMCMEFWNGWFDSWGLPHHTAHPQSNAAELDQLLATGASVNLYVLHGGTNFGLFNGANDKGVYRPIATSYDYDAPLSEHGTPTPKYWAMREVIARHAPVPAEVPDATPPAPTLTVRLDRSLPLWDVLTDLGEAMGFDELPTADAAGSSHGFTLYTVEVDARDLVMTLADVRDRATVFLDRDPVGVLSRTDGVRTLGLPARAGLLHVLVEDQGRVNYGPTLGEEKGLIGPARTVRRELRTWQVQPLDLTAVPSSVSTRLWHAASGDTDGPLGGPQLRLGAFDTSGGVDHFLSIRDWGRGLVWVNGFLLGRYSSQGPTRTLYVPGPLLRDRGNEVIVFETLAAVRGTLEFVAAPDLGSTES